MGHGAAGVVRQGLLETGDACFLIEAVTPVEAAVEPELGFRRRRGDRAAVRAQVEIAVHRANQNGFTEYDAESTVHGLQDLVKLFQRPERGGGEDELEMADTLVGETL